MKAWHFVGETLRDGRPVPPDGETLVHDGEIELCETGLHASSRLIHALDYARGATVCRVKLGGRMYRGEGKVVASERTILWRVDADDVLQRFARLCALDVIHLWDPPSVVVQYLKTGDDSLRGEVWAAARRPRRASWAAWAAAWAAGDPHRDVLVWGKARDAAWAAWAAASDAASAGVVEPAAWSVARDVARNAAEKRQNHRLIAMVCAARGQEGSGR